MRHFMVMIVITLSMNVGIHGQDLERIDSLKLAIDLRNSDNLRVDLLLELSEELVTNRPDEAEKSAGRALQLAEQLEYGHGILRSKRILAGIHQKKSNYKSALMLAEDAMELALELDDLKERAKICAIQGYVFSDLGEYEKSSRYMFECLSLYERTGEKKGISNALNSIGYVFFEQEQYDKALDYYTRSLGIAREINDPDGISRGLNNVAAVYGAKGEYDRLKRYLFEAIQINRQIGQRYWEGINYMNLGTLAQDEGAHDSAYYYFNKSIGVFSDLGHFLQWSNSLIGLSRHYLIVDSIDESIRCAHQALDLGMEHKLLRITSSAARQLNMVFEKTGAIDSAYYYGILHYRLKDSLDLENSITRMAQLELLYEFEKQNQQIKIHEQKKEYTYLLTIVILVFATILLFTIYYNRQKLKGKNLEMSKKQLELELEAKNKELAVNVMALMKKNEVVSEIAEKLMDLENEAVKDDTKAAIRRIARSLQKTGDDESWKEFEVRFKQVHGNFYEKLLKDFPELTPNEQKLCAFLRLNLSTKEISELTGQRISTLEVARSRLRKKLGIANSKVNLVTFLSQI